jgi:predicted DsbA family dithiol-disulfide isomerase
MPNTTSIRVDIFSDVICPWCFIGKRRLDMAISAYNQSRPVESQIKLDITWKGFLLNPTMPRQGMNRADYIRSKFGVDGINFYERIADVGKEVDIDFNFAAIKRTPDSRPALRLVLSAGGQATAVKQELLKAYFINGEDIGDDTVLAQIATRHDLPYPPPKDSDIRLKQNLAEAERLNIKGVPFFVIEGEWSVSGAHWPETFIPLFDAAITKNITVGFS